jgi:hypothetical protein
MARAAPILERATFRTSRLLDFASEKELAAQTGHRREAWPLVTLDWFGEQIFSQQRPPFLCVCPAVGSAAARQKTAVPSTCTASSTRMLGMLHDVHGAAKMRTSAFLFSGQMQGVAPLCRWRRI